jgi:hypothetical protein
LTITGDNIKIQAVYKLEKDELTIALFGKPENVRPKGFTAADAAGDGHIFVVRVLKRAQQPKLDKAKRDNEKEAFTAWGKEVGGLQAGLSFRPGEQRAYRHGETVKLVVRVRNVGKEKVTFQYVNQFLIEIPPTVTDAKGNRVPVGLRTLFGVHLPKQVNLAPGKEISLYGELEVRPDFGTGKVGVQYERVLGNSSSGQIKLAPNLEKLATGKLELEIKSDPPPAAEKKSGASQEVSDRPVLRNFTVTGTVTDAQNKPLDGVVVNIFRKAYAKDAKQPRIEEFGMTKTDSAGRFDITTLYPAWETEVRSGFLLKFSAPEFAPQSLSVDKAFDPKLDFCPFLPVYADGARLVSKAVRKRGGIFVKAPQ